MDGFGLNQLASYKVVGVYSLCSELFDGNMTERHQSFGNSLSVAYQWTLYLNVTPDKSCNIR